MMFVRRSAALALAVAFTLTPLGAFAQADPSPAPGAPAKAAPIPPATPDAVTHHSTRIDGKEYAYVARAGTIELRNQDEQPTLRMFYTAFTVEGAGGTARPITFVYNGGPGSSTMWLRMGSIGPVRVETTNATPTGPAPYHLVDNAQSLLDKTDLVFVDMPTSGFGRILGAGKPKDFYGVDQDARTFAQFIQRYLSTFNRWNSPKFLFGESYGTTRSAALVNLLQNDGVGINGVVLLSSILNYGLTVGGGPYANGDWQFVLYLPSLSAAAWFHHALPNQPNDLHALLPQVEHFAMNEYLNALAQGASISPALYSDVVAKLHQYTGLSSQYIRNSNLRIPYFRFQSELLRGSGRIVGRLDSRFLTYSIDVPEESPDWDPTDAAIDSAFTTTANQYVREQLRYDTNLLYRANVYDLIEQSGGWDFKHDGRQPTNVAGDLATALTYNPHLRVFSANGYYDFATPYFATEYTLNHLNLEPALHKHITFGFYESGHMVYLQPDARVQFKRDLAAWYDATLGR
jgi:carboxypeptidase C (cathepsin A)